MPEFGSTDIVADPCPDPQYSGNESKVYIQSSGSDNDIVSKAVQLLASVTVKK